MFCHPWRPFGTQFLFISTLPSIVLGLMVRSVVQAVRWPPQLPAFSFLCRRLLFQRPSQCPLVFHWFWIPHLSGYSDVDGPSLIVLAQSLIPFSKPQISTAKAGNYCWGQGIQEHRFAVSHECIRREGDTSEEARDTIVFYGFLWTCSQVWQLPVSFCFSEKKIFIWEECAGLPVSLWCQLTQWTLV